MPCSFHVEIKHRGEFGLNAGRYYLQRSRVTSHTDSVRKSSTLAIQVGERKSMKTTGIKSGYRRLLNARRKEMTRI